LYLYLVGFFQSCIIKAIFHFFTSFSLSIFGAVYFTPFKFSTRVISFFPETILFDILVDIMNTFSK